MEDLSNIQYPQSYNSDYVVNVRFPEEYRQKYEVNRFSGVSGLSILGNVAIGQLFGVGIRKAISNQKESENKINNKGYNVPNIYPDYPDAIKNAIGGYDRTAGWDGKMSSSLEGMPVMCYLKIKGGSYTDTKGNQQNIPDIIFETVVISANLSKNIEKTSIEGRDGSVKESICINDWDIEIRAIITADAPVNETVVKRNQMGVYPRDNMSEIYKALKAPIALPIECWFLNQFDINYIVVDKAKIEQVEGEYSMQRLVINATSDTPLIITIQS